MILMTCSGTLPPDRLLFRQAILQRLPPANGRHHDFEELVPSDESIFREPALLLGVRSTSRFEYLYPALQSLVMLFERSDQIIP